MRNLLVYCINIMFFILVIGLNYIILENTEGAVSIVLMSGFNIVALIVALMVLDWFEG